MASVLMFPGQGSQVIGMGKDFYDAYPQAREVFEEVDEVLGQKLSDLIFYGQIEDLTLTVNAQPALMTVSIAMLRVIEHVVGSDFIARFKYAMGHSLGEYTALTATGVLSLADCARLLRLRGMAMQEAVPAGIGSMAAIIGFDVGELKRLCGEVSKSLGQSCVLANDNSPDQVVISGHIGAVSRVMELAKESGAKRALLLPVSAPFHSPLMAPAALIMEKALGQIIWQDPKIPIISNVLAESVTQGEVFQQLLTQQVSGTVRFRESVQKLFSLSVDTFIEIGPGRVLSGLVKKTSLDAKTYNIAELKDMDVLAVL